ncbi:alpha/beta hydrolase [Rossellomorea sp. SC111]|uniref:alpha/beta fold hydrolase n=1 Tax=Rossellomorea sp. SC111 TaxID=2968985 RepID=UPI00215AD212|nr:alpha/beta hydrolase [Rossellomorea sp. SC111]MCR8849254.1 alpha/beta hydrolase [Rossellomorea sp. SC111]
MCEINLEYRILGEGKQILVLETGIGNSFYSWIPFMDRIKNDFTVILYHRAGYGKSGTSPEHRTTANIAMELNALMEHLKIDRFLLAGHSFGGLCAQQYARMYPGKLDGVLLIDATSHNFQRLYDLNLPVMYSMISLEQLIETNEETAGKSKGELEEWYKENNSVLSDEEEAFLTNPVLYQTISDEFANWSNSREGIKSGRPFPDIPLIVIARDEEFSAKPYMEHGIPEEEALLHEKVWRELQVELALLSKKGELVIAEGSDHEVHKDQPGIVVECLQKLKERQVPWPN